jgi:hypothetical protein
MVVVMTDKEAMKLALFALDIVKIHYTQSRHINEAITAIKERLAQPEQEPVAWMWDVNNGGGYTTRDVGLYQTSIPFAKHTPLYATPPQRKPLTDKAITQVIDSMPRGINGWMSDWDLYDYARAIEAKLKEKNT